MSNYAYTIQKLRWKGGQWGSRPLTGGGVSQDTKKSLKADTYIRPVRTGVEKCTRTYGPYVWAVCTGGVYRPLFPKI